MCGYILLFPPSKIQIVLFIYSFIMQLEKLKLPTLETKNDLNILQNYVKVHLPQASRRQVQMLVHSHVHTPAVLYWDPELANVSANLSLKGQHCVHALLVRV